MISLRILILISLGWTTFALDWKQAQGHRAASLNPPHEGNPGFTLMDPSRTGVLFTNFLSETRGLTNHILLNGSGVAPGDVDGDGWCDLYFAGLDGPNKLFKNLGEWRFKDITAESGAACEGIDSAGAVFADVDGDGDLDLLVSTVGKGVLSFGNDGKGRFTETTQKWGLASNHGSMTMALADVDGNGSLDLYVANYRTSTIRDSFQLNLKIRMVEGKPVVSSVDGRPTTDPDLQGRFTVDEEGRVTEHGESDSFYANHGGIFEEIPFTTGIFLNEAGKPLASPPFDWGLTAMFRDINGDQMPDLYVCNDLNSPDRIWINQPGGFRAIRPIAIRKTSWFSMGIDFADINRDGYDDFFVADMLSREHVKRHTQVNNHQKQSNPPGAISNRPQYPRNTLFYGFGDGEFAEGAYFAGVHASDWSWSPVFLDVDLDGYEDLLITTGFERDVQDVDVAQEIEQIRQEKKLNDQQGIQLRKRFPKLAQANLAFANKGGLKFEERGAAWGFNQVGVSQGMALADLDNDGDLDVVVNNMNQAAFVLRNNSTAPRLAIRLKGKVGNTRGIGAKIKVSGGPVTQTQEMICGGRYLSGDDAMRVFAVGSSTNRLTVQIIWRSGHKSIVQNVEPNQVVEIDESSSKEISEEIPEIQPLFKDFSTMLKHQHTETDFDDFGRQPLLPKKLSQAGPGIAWGDLNEDGYDDLVVGAGKKGRLGVFIYDKLAGLAASTNPVYAQAITRDLTGLAIFKSGGEQWVLAGSSNYEDGLARGTPVRGYGLSPSYSFQLPPQLSTPGPLAIADVDGNGELDLFVGGVCLPGRYPEAANSYLYLQKQGKWSLDTDNAALFVKVGMVNGAVWTDLNEDGWPDLVLAREWDSLKVFLNEKGKLKDATESWGLTPFKGLWNGVAAGDFDGDGKMDLVASNWGKNSRHAPHLTRSIKLFYGDWLGDGSVQMLESYFEESLKGYAPWQTLSPVSEALPFVAEKFKTHARFGSAAVPQILGEKMASTQTLEANSLETAIFLNRGGRFEKQDLPWQAQLTPAFGVSVADFNGDGTEDLFLAQNFFAVDPFASRLDAGRGLLLTNQGSAVFLPMSGEQSGIRIYGEQRGAAVADFDGDGRPDLAVGQNGSATRLFVNNGARRGWRIRLKGPGSNPYAIGAVLRLCKVDEGSEPGTFGPARELHSGSGWLSQDSPVPVLPPVKGQNALWVRWPGGGTTVTPLSLKKLRVVVGEGGLIVE